MDLVINGGPGSTARNAKINGITVCGKTGTAENPHGNDHSIFIAFAPKDDPKIAIAVYVENQGFGTTYAAPIASLMIEKYLTGEVKRTWYENWVMQKEQPVIRSSVRSADTAQSPSQVVQTQSSMNLFQIRSIQRPGIPKCKWSEETTYW